ncbi:cupin-like domain-containing protein [Dyella lutea]|uniref:Cupin-like domain-containing protein n=1 Tax=Dyella lutea TaxID=2950441 RepID=A0ABT1F7I1_9GAMM|nr:cupin-like domain-containing protein [Dyella lutea]MCP1373339.1 cupin-like domain-containing protein [Dyella lutea]
MANLNVVVASQADALSSAESSDLPPVDRVEGLGVDDFVARYRLPRRPVVLTDALKQWPANGRYTPEFFARAHADLEIRCAGKTYRLAEALSLQDQATEGHPGPYPCTIKDARSFVRDIMPRLPWALPNRHTHPLVPELIFNSISHIDIFFGGAGNQFPFPHYDYLRMHGWVAQLYGNKEMTLYEPGQEHLMYVDPQRPWRSVMEYADQPDYERYPLFRQVRSRKVLVRAGEALFIPCGTWHTARCLDPGISVLFDQLEASNWREFTGEVVAMRRRAGQPLKAAAIGAYLRVLGPLLGIAERFGANRRPDWGVPTHAGEGTMLHTAGAG